MTSQTTTSELKNEIISSFKAACTSFDGKKILDRMDAFNSQFQKDIFQINNTELGIIQIRDSYNECYIVLYPLIQNKLGLKAEVVSFEINKKEYEELRKLYFKP